MLPGKWRSFCVSLNVLKGVLYDFITVVSAVANLLPQRIPVGLFVFNWSKLGLGHSSYQTMFGITTAYGIYGMLFTYN